MQPHIVREARRRLNFSDQLAEKGWCHSFRLPDGTLIDGYNSLRNLHERYSRFPIPPNLSGTRVLDIGTWDGWFAFEAERHGAEVTAIDCIEVPNFLEIRRQLSSRVDYRIVDLYDVPAAGLGQFDIVFFLGVLYHLKHPLLALEIVCSLTRDIALVESFVTDSGTWQEHQGDIPTMEFYETDELGGQLDNWIGPTVGCLLALCRSAGFARVDLLHAADQSALVACHRTWEPEPSAPTGDPPELIALENNRKLGTNFSSRKDEYLSCWFQSTRPSVARQDLHLEVDGFGVPALYVGPSNTGSWLANFRIPPGLTPGWKAVRLRFCNSAFGRPLPIAVDLPLEVDQLELIGVCDARTSKPGEVALSEEGQGFLSCWVAGLPDNADRGNVCAQLGDIRLRVDWVGQPDAQRIRQINVAVRREVMNGRYPFHIQCSGAASNPLPLLITHPPAFPS